MIQSYCFFLFFSITAYHRILDIVLCALQQDLDVYAWYSSCVAANPKLPIYPSSIPLPLWQAQACSLRLWVCFCLANKFICVTVQILHISDIIGHLPFSFWFISLSMIISRSTHVTANGIISFFFMTSSPLYVSTTSSLSIHLSMMFRLFPCLGYCKCCCYEHLGPCIFLICQGVGLLDHMATLFLVFWQISLPFSIVAAWIFLSFPFFSSFFFPKQRVGTGLAPKSLHNTHHKWSGGQIRTALLNTEGKGDSPSEAPWGWTLVFYVKCG